GDAFVVDERRRAQLRQARLERFVGDFAPRLLALRELGYGLNVDVPDTEEAPVGRGIGTRLPRRLGEQAVKRIETDGVGAEAGAELPQRRQPREVADAPIAPRAEAIELEHERPLARPRGANGVAALRSEEHTS